jgi:hypothetical protein
MRGSSSKTLLFWKKKFQFFSNKLFVRVTAPNYFFHIWVKFCTKEIDLSGYRINPWFKNGIPLCLTNQGYVTQEEKGSLIKKGYIKMLELAQSCVQGIRWSVHIVTSLSLSPCHVASLVLSSLVGPLISSSNSFHFLEFSTLQIWLTLHGMREFRRVLRHMDCWPLNYEVIPCNAMVSWGVGQHYQKIHVYTLEHLVSILTIYQTFWTKTNFFGIAIFQCCWVCLSKSCFSWHKNVIKFYIHEQTSRILRT